MNLTITPVNTKSGAYNKPLNFKSFRMYPSMDNPLYSGLIEIGKNSSIGVVGNRYLANILDKDFTESLRLKGIKNVVDMLNRTKSHIGNGIEYLGIDMDSVDGLGFMCRPPFGHHNYYSIDTTINDAEYTKRSQAYVKKFVRLIQMLQEGNTFLRGDFVPDAEFLLSMNKFFNPQADKVAIEKAPAHLGGIHIVERFKRLYRQLTPEAKKAMNWTKEFDKNVIPNLDKDLADMESFRKKNKNFITQ
ncbi:hypothetical protein J6S88_06790 [bacterium]|nr:hypothetical protein [bacterium]